MNNRPHKTHVWLRLMMAALLINVWTLPVQAIEDTPFNMFLGGAYPFSLGVTHEYMRGEYGILGGFSYKQDSWPVGMQFEGMSYRFGFSDRARDFAGSDGFMQITAGTANITWTPDEDKVDWVRPYTIGGVGIYNRMIKTTQERPITENCWDPWFGYYPCGGTANVATNSYSETKMGLNAGGGVAFEISSGRELFVEVRYHHVFTSHQDTQFLPVNIGFRW